MEDKSAAQQIDAIIKKYDDWRGEMMSRLRALIKQADPALPLDHFGGLLLAWYSSDILTVLREPEEQANRRGYARADQCRRDCRLVWIPRAPHRKLRRGRGSDPSLSFEPNHFRFPWRRCERQRHSRCRSW